MNPSLDSDIDWMKCELIARIPGKVSGRPIVRFTRILPDAIVDGYDSGQTTDELQEGFPSLSLAQIERLIEFAHTERAQHKPKALLDEHLDQSLRKLLGEHEIVTVSYMGWAGLTNGEPLRRAEERGIHVLVTGDQTLSYEQNLTGRKLAIVVLSAIQLSILRKNLPRIITAIGSSTPGSFQVVGCGTFSRKRL